MKMLMLYANGFEDVEAIATRDVLVRAGIEVVDMSINENEDVTSSHNLRISGLKSASKSDLSSFSGIILPGGSHGVNNLLLSDFVLNTVKEFYDQGKLVCAICAAPMVLGKLGLLKNREFTCYPGCEKGLDGIYTGKEVVEVDNIITGRSMLFSIAFGLKIIERLLGKAKSEQIYNQIAGLSAK